MSGIAPKLGYKIALAGVGQQIKAGPTGFFGLSASGAGGAITVYDSLTAAGSIIYSGTLTAGGTTHWGGTGIACKLGLYVVSAGDCVILYT